MYMHAVLTNIIFISQLRVDQKFLCKNISMPMTQDSDPRIFILLVKLIPHTTRISINLIKTLPFRDLDNKV